VPNSNLAFFPKSSNTDKYNYVGWIPCISGHLDFGLMTPELAGDFSKDENQYNDRKSLNYSRFGNNDSHHRNILLHSKVDWKDYRSNPSTSGWTGVTVIAETQSSDNIDNRNCHGYVILNVLKEKTETGLLAKFRDKFSESEPKFEGDDTLYEKLIEARDIFNGQDKDPYRKKVNWPGVQKTLNNKFKDIKECADILIHGCRSDNLFVIKFMITSTGVTYLNYEGPNLEGYDQKVTDRAKYTLCRQAFYYLKYSLHSHKHHEYEHDALTTIEPLHNSPIKELDNPLEDLGYKIESLTDTNIYGLKMIARLKRELINQKRYASSDSNNGPIENEALGISAYIKSLITSLHDTKIITDRIKERELSRLKSIEESFIAQSDRIDNKIETEYKAKTVERQIAQLFLAIITGAFIIGYNTQSKVTVVYEIQKMPSEPTDTALIIFGIVFLLMCLVIGLVIKTLRWRRNSKVNFNVFRKIKIPYEIAKMFIVTIFIFSIASFIRNLFP